MTAPAHRLEEFTRIGQFLAEVAEWLLFADWVLFLAGSVYGAVQVGAVLNWPRVSTIQVRADVKTIAEGRYSFAPLENLLWPPDDGINADDKADEATIEDE